MHKLIIEKNVNNLYVVFGAEENLLNELNWWVNHEINSANEGIEKAKLGDNMERNFQSEKPRIIDGFADESGKKEMKMAYIPGNITGMSLMKVH